MWVRYRSLSKSILRFDDFLRGPFGERIDFFEVHGGFVDFFKLIVKLKLPFDQLIDEHGYSWIHVSYSEGKNRRQVLHVK